MEHNKTCDGRYVCRFVNYRLVDPTFFASAVVARMLSLTL